MAKVPTRSTAAAVLRVEEAMEAVERAQRELNRATQLLSAVRGGMQAYEAVGKETDRVHALWRRLRNLSKRPRLSLDSEDVPGPEPERQAFDTTTNTTGGIDE